MGDVCSAKSSYSIGFMLLPDLADLPDVADLPDLALARCVHAYGRMRTGGEETSRPRKVRSPRRHRLGRDWTGPPDGFPGGRRGRCRSSLRYER